MKSLITILLLVGADIVSAADLPPESRQKLIEFVDSLHIPIPPGKMKGAQPISDGGDERGLRVSKTLISGDKAFRDGLEASLIGPPKRPMAVVFWVQSAIGYYYVPFAGVTEVDRPRRLSKVGDRVYRIESNRSPRKGVRVEKRLP